MVKKLKTSKEFEQAVTQLNAAQKEAVENLTWAGQEVTLAILGQRVSGYLTSLSWRTF